MGQFCSFPSTLRSAALLLLLLPLFGGTACTSSPPQISIEGPTAELSPAFLGVVSVYFTVRNDGGRDALTGVTAGLPNALVELHDVQNNRMAKVDRIPVPGRGELKLRPGGFHLMAFNLPRSLKEGDQLALTLRFERSGERHVTARVVRAGGGPRQD